MRFSVLMTIYFGLFAAPALSQTITLATGNNIDPPYVMGQDTIPDAMPGVTIELLKLIEQQLEVTFQVSKKPWARVVKEVEDGTLDGGFHFSYLPERREAIAFPIIADELVPDPSFSISPRSDSLYRLKGNTVYWDGQLFVDENNQLASLGVIRGGAVTTKFALDPQHIVEVSSDQQLIHLLLRQRVDGIIGLDSMMDARIANLPATQRMQIEKVAPPLATKHFYIAFSPQFMRQNTVLAWSIWHALKEIKDSGEYDFIVSQYANEPLQQGQ